MSTYASPAPQRGVVKIKIYPCGHCAQLVAMNALGEYEHIGFTGEECEDE